MKKTALIKYYLKLFFLSLLFLIFTTSLLLKTTILDKNYLFHTLNNSNYYNQLSKDLEEQFEENLMSTGFDKTILQEFYQKDYLQNKIETIINTAYYTKDYDFETKDFSNKLTENINSFLKDKEYNPKDSDIKDFTKEITKIYKNQLILGDILPPSIKFITSLDKIITITLITSLMLILIFLVIKRKRLNKYLIVPLIFTSFIFLFLYIYVKLNLDIEHFTFYSTAITELIRYIINNVLKNFLITFIAYFILGITLYFITYKEPKKWY